MTTVIGGIMHNAATGDMKVMTDTGLVSIGNGGNGGITTGSLTVSSGTVSSSTLSFGGFDMEDFLDTHSFNKITVEHKVAEFELAKLKETVPTYADEIKENLSKNLARDIIKKTTFTKKHNVDSDTHHFLGRVWVFTEDELKNLIQEARNA
jgi:hypothetical protein